ESTAVAGANICSYCGRSAARPPHDLPRARDPPSQRRRQPGPPARSAHLVAQRDRPPAGRARSDAAADRRAARPVAVAAQDAQRSEQHPAGAAGDGMTARTPPPPEVSLPVDRPFELRRAASPVQIRLSTFLANSMATGRRRDLSSMDWTQTVY